LPTTAQADRQKIVLDHQRRAEEESKRKKEEERAWEREQQERERQEKERQQKERQQKEQQEKERLEKERQQKEQQERERLEKNRWEKERLDHERLEREQQEKADKVRQERQRLERLERERMDKEQLEIEKLQQAQEIRKHSDINTVSEGIGAVALYDYQKDEDNEIDLREGENISNVTDLGEGWYSGTNSLGYTGLFPGNYVQLVNADNFGSDPVEKVTEDSMICAVALVN
jgi:hypothetical protein